MSRCQHSGIPPARLSPNRIVLLNENNVVAILHQLIGRSYAYDAPAKNHNAHADLRLRWRLLDNRR
jgi:hypothetical protein